MKKEIKKQLQRINDQIETEKKIHAAWTNYKDCEMKTQVINQSIGVVRGLEVAKESLEFLLDSGSEQMTIDDITVPIKIPPIPQFKFANVGLLK